MGEAKTTTVETLLGMLSMGPLSGYELKQLIGRSIGNFWSESFGQIYPALRRMVAEGLAEVEDAPAGGRERKVYRLTDAGRRRLERWLELPVREQVPRNELLLKLFFGAGMQPRQVRNLLKTERKELLVDLNRYLEISRTLQVQHRGHPALKFWLMTVSYGIAKTQALVMWCDESLSMMGESQ